MIEEAPAPAPDLAYYEAVPYLLVVELVERAGEWLRCAEHPELPGCRVEAPSAVGGAPTRVPPPPHARGERA